MDRPSQSSPQQQTEKKGIAACDLEVSIPLSSSPPATVNQPNDIDIEGLFRRQPSHRKRQRPSTSPVGTDGLGQRSDSIPTRSPMMTEMGRTPSPPDPKRGSCSLPGNASTHKMDPHHQLLANGLLNEWRDQSKSVLTLIAESGGIEDCLRLTEWLLWKTHPAAEAATESHNALLKDIVTAFGQFFPEATPALIQLYAKQDSWDCLGSVLLALDEKGEALEDNEERSHDGLLAAFLQRAFRKRRQRQLDTTCWEKKLSDTILQCMASQWKLDVAIAQDRTTATRSISHLIRCVSAVSQQPAHLDQKKKQMNGQSNKLGNRLQKVVYPTISRLRASRQFQEDTIRLERVVSQQRSATSVTQRHQTIHRYIAPEFCPNINNNVDADSARSSEQQQGTTGHSQEDDESEQPNHSLYPSRLMFGNHPIHLCFADDKYIDDELLRTIPEMGIVNKKLLTSPVRHLTRDSNETIVYIHQGEVGHAVPSQCDVLVSDKATTCHILALFSRPTSNNGKQHSSLSTIAHIDSCEYEQSIEQMILAHASHHRPDMGNSAPFEEPEKNQKLEASNDYLVQSEEKNVCAERIEVEVHILGGFLDERGSSRRITLWLMDLLACLADVHQARILLRIKTCAVSSMNHDRRGPIGRGLGINTRSGTVFLAKVAAEAAGPAEQVRSARIWCGGGSTHGLSLVHVANTNDDDDSDDYPNKDEMSFSPFALQPFSKLETYLSLSSSKMLRRTSTSPEAEEPDFVHGVKATLRFIRNVNAKQVFGRSLNDTRKFERIGSSNYWKKKSHYVGA